MKWVSYVALVVNNLPANAGDIRDTGLIPGSGRSLEGGHGNPLQYSCLGNPKARGARWATVHEVTKGRTHPSTRTIQLQATAQKRILSLCLQIQHNLYFLHLYVFRAL